MVTTKAIEQLSSIPTVLAGILDALYSGAGTADVTAIVHRDAVLSGKLLATANASNNRCQTVPQAIESLGENQLRTLLVTHGLRQFFKAPAPDGNLESQIQLWRNGLLCAHFSRILATLTSYHCPEEAYLSGLWANLGQLMLLEEYGEAYSLVLQGSADNSQLSVNEQQQFSQNHADIGAGLVANWQPSSFIADAIRYQNEAIEQIQDAHHLVKIIHCANKAINGPACPQGLLDAAEQLFGLNAALTRELYSRNVEDIDKLSTELALSSPSACQTSSAQLGIRLGELSEVAQLNTGILQASSLESLAAGIQQSLLLSLGINHSVLFSYDEQQNLLSTYLTQATESADFKLALEPGRSLASDCLLSRDTLDSSDNNSLSVIDRQLLHYCQGDILACWPLSHNGKAVGVLAFAVDQPQLDEMKRRHELLHSLCQHIAKALSTYQPQTQLFGDSRQSTASLYQQKIHEAVHEASNPLSIIRNYLEMLRLKLGDEHEANENLELIKEEIEHVGIILSTLKEEPTIFEPDTQTLDVKQLIEDTAQIIKESICVAKSLTLQLQLDEQLTETQGNPHHLKQVLTNLLKNAAEALEPGGKITISSDNAISFGGQNYLAISIADNGPGIPAAIKNKLFSPVTSSKGKGHSGLGLSIVKKLIDEMGGLIVCRSNEKSGTEFQILLPRDIPA